MRSTGITGQSSLRGMWFDPEHVPEHDVGRRRWRGRPAVHVGQAGAAGVLERVVAGRVALVGGRTASPTGGGT